MLTKPNCLLRTGVVWESRPRRRDSWLPIRLIGHPAASMKQAMAGTVRIIVRIKLLFFNVSTCLILAGQTRQRFEGLADGI